MNSEAITKLFSPPRFHEVLTQDPSIERILHKAYPLLRTPRGKVVIFSDRADELPQYFPSNFRRRTSSMRHSHVLTYPHDAMVVIKPFKKDIYEELQGWSGEHLLFIIDANTPPDNTSLELLRTYESLGAEVYFVKAEKGKETEE